MSSNRNSIIRSNHFFFIIKTLIQFVCIGGLAAAIPHLNDIISLVGASGAAFLSFIFPTIFHWILFSNEIGRLTMFKNIVIIILGIVGSITGTFASLRNIITDDD